VIPSSFFKDESTLRRGDYTVNGEVVKESKTVSYKSESSKDGKSVYITPELRDNYSETAKPIIAAGFIATKDNKGRWTCSSSMECLDKK
jgi:hypothetical protein